MYKQKYYKRKYNSKAALYQQPSVMGEKKVIDNVINVEWQTNNRSINVATARSGSVTGLFAMNLVRVGSSMNNRVGRKIRMSSFRLDGNFSFISATSNFRGPEKIRIMLVYDRQTNGALPAIQDILQCIEQDGTQSTTVWCGLNLNNRDRFLVIMDEKKMMPALIDNEATGIQNGFPATVDNWGIDVYRKIKGLETLYKADSAPAVIGDISAGSLLFVAVAQNEGTSDPDAGTHWKFQGNLRLRFHDM